MDSLWLLPLALTVVVGAIFWRWFSNGTFPQVPGFWILGHIPDFWGKDFEKALIKHWKAMEGHDLFMQRKLHEDIYGAVVPRNLSWIKTILSDTGAFAKAMFLESLVPALNGSLVSLNGQAHHKLRVELAKAFTPQSLKRYVPGFSRSADSLCKKWRLEVGNACRSKCLKVQPSCQDLTFEVICEAAFGYRLSEDVAGRVGEINRRALEGGLSYKQQLVVKYLLPFLRYLPFGPANHVHEALRAIEELVWKIFHQRKEAVEHGRLSEAEKHNILSILLESRDGEGSLSDKEIVSNVFLFLLAGLETTSTALTWAIYALAMHSDVQERLRDEIAAVLPQPTVATYDELGNLHHLNNFVKETLRFYAPIDMVSRRTTADLQLGAYNLKKGTMVQCQFACVHRDERFYDAPDTFDPDRFASGGNIQPGAFLAFSYGPHDCIGKKFAILELKVALVHILRNFRVEPDPAFHNYVTEFPIARTSKPSVSVKLCLRD